MVSAERTEKNTTEASLWVWLRHGLLGIALAVMLVHFALYVVYGIALIRFPFDYDQGEGFELVDTIMLAEGKWPYRDNETFPFYASNYPPLYHVVLIPFAWIFGKVYWYGRLVAFISTLITAGAIGYAVHRETRHRPVALLSGLMFLASNYIYHIGPLLRQHLFMVMFEVLAVVILANAFSLPTSQQRRRFILGMILLVCAGYTKQLAYATVIAVLGWMFIRNPRRAIVYGAGVAVSAGVIFLWLNIATQGEWWTNIIAANVNAYYPWQFRGLLEQFLRLHWPLLIMASLMLVYELYFSRLSIYSVWFVLAGVNSALSGKWGAGDSYFASFIVAMCILAGIFIGHSWQGQWQFPPNYLSRWAQVLLPLKRIRLLQTSQFTSLISLGLVVIYGFTVIKLPTEGPFFGPLSDRLGLAPAPGHRYPLYDAAGWTEGYATIGHLPSPQDMENGWRIVERIRALDAPVMSEDAGFSLRADRVVVSNPTQLKNLYENELFDPASLVTMIENQELGMIIFRAQFYPPPVLAAAYDAYTPREIIPMNGFNYELWYPDPTWEYSRPLRDYLRSASGPSAPLEVNLPKTLLAEEGMTVEAWLAGNLTHWAWKQVDVSNEVSGDDDCLGMRWQQADNMADLRVCETAEVYNIKIRLQ